jgi:hypothetical protein
MQPAMKNYSIVIVILLAGNIAYAQQRASTDHFIEAGFAAARKQGTFTVAYFYNQNLGKKKRVTAGIGARATVYVGSDQYYITAPAKLTSGSTGPGVLFKENIKANIDTFRVQSPQVNAVNLLINLGYHLSDKVFIGFSIDAIGYSFGSRVLGTYINGQQRMQERAEVTSFNILLISDNDKGSLNSELYARYQVNDRISLKAGVQFLFTEYTTYTDIQTIPEPNDRFRRKSLLAGLGVACKL